MVFYSKNNKTMKLNFPRFFVYVAVGEKGIKVKENPWGPPFFFICSDYQWGSLALGDSRYSWCLRRRMLFTNIYGDCELLRLQAVFLKQLFRT